MLTQNEIEKIVHLDNLILKNLKITQGYYELSQGMAQVIGPENANWCTFATHASKTAGYAIRQEVLPNAIINWLSRLSNYQEINTLLNRYLEKPSQEQLQVMGNGLIQEVLLLVSLNISVGNCKVFAELAGPFAQMIASFGQDRFYDGVKLERFLAQFRPGAVEQNGQDYLMEAFTAYYQARFETDPKRKAELIFKANLLVGLHEQIRLQPHIADALQAPINKLVDYRVADFSGRFLSNLTPTLQKRASSVVRRSLCRLMTQAMMFVTLPSGDLLLGKDVLKPPAGNSKFPVVLMTLENHRLNQLLQQWDRTLDTLTGSAAENWARLTDRMNFIVDLFRSHQQSHELFRPPFSLSQQMAIRAGQIPDQPQELLPSGRFATYPPNGNSIVKAFQIHQRLLAVKHYIWAV